ncbi:hypothetical protein [Nocardia jejuensis]|uniref:hypothetical protein n=1 Tax=Nocardia jejuensis TaxID=328049 RepID=UPI0012FBCD2B|nr:hypothetical protein [Nocardia jejuensis]
MGTISEHADDGQRQPAGTSSDARPIAVSSHRRARAVSFQLCSGAPPKRSTIPERVSETSDLRIVVTLSAVACLDFPHTQWCCAGVQRRQHSALGEVGHR